MATTIGRVEYDVDIDGRTLPAQARKIGRDIGKSMGDGTQEAFSKEINDLGKELSRDMQKNGELAGNSFTDSMRRILQSDLGKLSDDVARAFSNTDRFKEYLDGLGGIGEGSEKLRAQMTELNEAGLLSDVMFGRLGDSMDEQVGKWKTSNDAVRELLINTEGQSREVERLTSVTDKDTESQKRWGSAMDSNNGRMSHGARQALFFTGLFAALGDEIAVLGSAAGSSMAVLGSVMLSGGIATGVAIAAFKDLGADLETLPAIIQPAAAAFQGLGDNMSAMQDALESAALKDLAPTFEKLGPLIDAMIGPLATVATSVGAVATNLVDMLTSEEGVANLTALILAAGPAFESLMSAVFNLSGALGDIFVVAIPYAQIFVDYLDRLFTDFNTWTSSLEGQNALEEWFDNGLFIMTKVGDLLAATGQALADLVTPQAVQQVGELLDNLTEFMPILGEILGVVGKLNIFGLISELLLELGKALQPILPQLGEMAELISGTLSTAFATLGPVVGQLLAALAPVVSVVLELAASLIEALLPVIGPIVTVVTALLGPFTMLLTAIMPIIEVVAGLIVALSPLIELIGALLSVALLPLQAGFAALGPVIELIAPVLDLVTGALGLLTPAIELLTDWLLELVPTYGSAEAATEGMGTSLELLGAVFTWLNDVIIQPIIKAIGAAFKWVWEVAIKPVVDFIVKAFELWGRMFKFLLDNFIMPIINNIGKLFEGLWKTFVKPAIDAIGKAWTDLYNGMIKPIADKISEIIGVVGKVIGALWKIHVQPTLDNIGRAFNDLYNGVIKPITDKIGEVVDLVGKAIGIAFEGAAAAMKGAFDGVASFFRDVFNGIISGINTVIDGLNGFGDVVGSVLGVNFDSLGRLPMLASGAVTNGPMRAIIGEAGPEAVVPLDRPLGAVNPAVRELSAFAQGKLGNTGGDIPSKVINFLAGAIVIQTLGDPEQAASAVVNRISEDL